MAAIAGWASRAVHVAGAVVRDPPVRARLNMVRKPLLLRDVPLRGQGKVVIAALDEVSLLIPASIHKGDFVDTERPNRVGVGKVP